MFTWPVGRFYCVAQITTALILVPASDTSSADFPRLGRKPDKDLMTVVPPEFIPARWWQRLLHNQSTLPLKGALLFKGGVPRDRRALSPQALASLLFLCVTIHCEAGRILFLAFLKVTVVLSAPSLYLPTGYLSTG
jgi:hypothetical protein